MVIKILIFGDDGVGKSTIRFYDKVDETFPKHTDLSGVNINTKSLHTDRQKITFSLWEINANIESRMLIDTNAFVGVHALIFMFDVSNTHSLNYIKRIHSKVFNLLNNKNIGEETEVSEGAAWTKK